MTRRKLVGNPPTSTELSRAEADPKKSSRTKAEAKKSRDVASKPSVGIRRRWTLAADPYDQFTWVTSRVHIVNKKTGEAIYDGDVEHPEGWSQNAVDTVASKYFRKAGLPGIGGETSVRQLIHRVVTCLVKMGKKRGYFANNKEAEAFYDEIVFGFLSQRLGFNTPVWLNFGLYDVYGIKGTKGRERYYVDPATEDVVKIDTDLERPGGAACYLSAVDDQLLGGDGNSMYQHLITECSIFVSGAGDGFNASTIRGKGEPISGGGISSGIIPYLKVRDAASGYIKSGGVARRSATLICLNVDHPDIEEFIHWKGEEEKKAKILIKAGYPPGFEQEAYQTVSGQNSNNSVRCPDSFMESVYEDLDWHLVSRCPYENFKNSVSFQKLYRVGTCKQGDVYAEEPNGKIVAIALKDSSQIRRVMRTVRAKDIWNLICETTWACGCPGVQFHDTINAWNTVPHYGTINTTNPCLLGDTRVKVIVKEGDEPVDEKKCRTMSIAEATAEQESRRDDMVVYLMQDYVGDWSPVVFSMTKNNAEFLVVRTSNGGTIRCTPNHRLKLSSGGDVEAVKSIGCELDPVGKVISIEPGGSDDVYDFNFLDGRPDDGRWGVIYAEDGLIYLVHNCAEVCLPDWSVCNLGSINLVHFFDDFDKCDWDGYEHACKLMTVALDLVVEVSSYPTPMHAKGCYNLRSIGENHGNIGATLMRNAIPYDSDDARIFMALASSIQTLVAWETSHLLAERLGSYPVYHEENHRRVMKMHETGINDVGHALTDLQYSKITPKFSIEKVNLIPDISWRFRDLSARWAKLADAKGFRNNTVTCLVPQGTIGLVLDQDTAGCEPDFALVKHKKCVGGHVMEIVNASVEHGLKKLGYGPITTVKILEYVQRWGTVELCPNIADTKHENIFATAARRHNTISAKDVVTTGMTNEAKAIFEKAGDVPVESIMNDLPEDVRTEIGYVVEAIAPAKNLTQARKLAFTDMVLARYGEKRYNEVYARLKDRYWNAIKVFSVIIGVNGHIDALAAIQRHISMSISKCVTGDTLIHTESGFIKIGDLYDGSQKPDTFSPMVLKVQTKEGCEATDSFYYGGSKPIKRMLLSNGQTISATSNHPLFSCSSGGEDEPGWNQTGELVPGDYVAIDIGRDTWSSTHVDTSSFKPSPACGSQKIVDLPSTINEDIGWLLGAFAADGGGTRTNWTIRITKNNPMVLEKIKSIVENVFKVHVNIDTDPRNGVTSTRFTSKTIYEFFEWIGSMSKSGEKEIPWAIMQSPRPVVQAFIGGLWLDGFVPHEIAMAGITLKSKILIDQLQVLMYNFGIRTSRCIKYVESSAYHHMQTSSRDDLEKFSSTFVMDQAHKTENIRVHLAQPVHEMARYDSDFVPDFVRTSAAKAYQAKFELKPRTIKFGTLIRQSTKRCSWKIADEALRLSGELGLGTTHWVQVVSVTDDVEEVFDLSVPGSRSFIGNAVVCHNTVNADYGATVADVAAAYERAHRSGVKCVALYVDGSKGDQPLNTGSSSQGDDKQKPKSIEGVDPSIVPEQTKTFVAKAVDANNEWISKWPAVRRPPENYTRTADSIKVTISDPTHGKVSVFVHLDRYNGTNSLMHLFADMGKSGETVSGLLESLARVISVSVQYGTPVKALGEVLEGMSFSPRGMLGKTSILGIRHVKSVSDLIGQLLQKVGPWWENGSLIDELYPAPVDPHHPITVKMTKIDQVKSEPKSEQVDAKPPSDEINSSAMALRYGYTGKQCDKCFGFRTVGSQKCFTCKDCGHDSGPCGS